MRVLKLYFSYFNFWNWRHHLQNIVVNCLLFISLLIVVLVVLQIVVVLVVHFVNFFIHVVILASVIQLEFDIVQCNFTIFAEHPLKHLLDFLYGHCLYFLLCWLFLQYFLSFFKGRNLFKVFFCDHDSLGCFCKVVVCWWDCRHFTRFSAQWVRFRFRLLFIFFLKSIFGWLLLKICWMTHGVSLIQSLKVLLQKIW